VVRVLRCLDLGGWIYKGYKEGGKVPFLDQHLCDCATDARGTAWGLEFSFSWTLWRRERIRVYL